MASPTPIGPISSDSTSTISKFLLRSLDIAAAVIQPADRHQQ